MFLQYKFNQKLESSGQVDTTLKIHTKTVLNVLADRNLFNLSEWKFNTHLDCIATNKIINDNVCKSRKNAQDLATGKISERWDSKGLNSCLDLHAMIKCVKNASMLHNMDKFEKKAHPVSRSY